MDLAIVYLTQRFFYRVVEFFRHWYIKSMRVCANHMMNWLQRLDYTLAWRITFKNIFQPLFGDFSVIGYVIGFVFRISRLIIGGIIYICIFSIALTLYVVWLIAPLYILFKVVTSIAVK